MIKKGLSEKPRTHCRLTSVLCPFYILGGVLDMKWGAIKFVISPYRIKKIKLPPKPIQRSEYAESLFQEGAGWNERKAD